MSQILIEQLLNELGSPPSIGHPRESVVREAFKTCSRAGGGRRPDFRPRIRDQTPQTKNAATSTARCSTRCACLSATGRRRTRRTTSTRRSRTNSAAATRRTTSSSRTLTQAVLIQDRRGDALPRSMIGPARKAARALLRLRTRRDRRVPQGGRAVQDRSAGGAQSAARDDRAQPNGEREFRAAPSISSSMRRRRSTRALPQPTCARC